MDLLAVQGTLKSLLQHFKSINSLALSFLYSPTLTPMHDYWKNIALTRWIFVSKVMSLVFNMLYRLVTAFLPRNKHLLTSWLQSPSAMILEPPKNKVCQVSTVPPSICHEVMGPDAVIFVFLLLSFKPDFHSPLWVWVLLQMTHKLFLLEYMVSSHRHMQSMERVKRIL